MSKKTRRPEVADCCKRALERVEQAILNHQRGHPEDLDITTLEQVAKELGKMAQALNKTKYQPAYARFLLDWPDEHGLVEYLIGVSQDYCRWT